MCPTDSPRNRIWKPEYGIRRRGITVEVLFQRLKDKYFLTENEVQFQRIKETIHHAYPGIWIYWTEEWTGKSGGISLNLMDGTEKCVQEEAARLGYTVSTTMQSAVSRRFVGTGATGTPKNLRRPTRISRSTWPDGMARPSPCSKATSTSPIWSGMGSVGVQKPARKRWTLQPANPGQ